MVFGILYWVGLIITWIALYQRVDFPSNWREFYLSNIGWFSVMSLKIVAWPITFGHWLYMGRRPSQWKAVTKLEGREVRKIVRLKPVD
jgi:hypothetical protein